MGTGAEVGFEIGDRDGSGRAVLSKQDKNDRKHDRDPDGKQSSEGMINAAKDRLLVGHRAMMFGSGGR